MPTQVTGSTTVDGKIEDDNSGLSFTATRE